MDDKVIFYDSPEACVKGNIIFEDGTSATIYKATTEHGTQLFKNESDARHSGSTHRQCPETGEVFDKCYIDGPSVRRRKEREKYLSLSQIETDFPIFIDDRFINDEDDLQQWADDLDGPPNLAECEVYCAGKLSLNEIEIDQIFECSPDYEWEPSTELQTALTRLNEIIRNEPSGYYESIQARPTDAQIAEWNDLIGYKVEAQGGE